MKPGDQFSLWTVVSTDGANRANSYKIECRCVCGTVRSTQAKYLRTGKSKSCGCDGYYVGAMLEAGEVVAIRVDKNRFITVRCECGNEFESRAQSGGLRSGCRSCAIGNRYIHGDATEKPKEYRAWKGMRQRCDNPKNKSYVYYGARGISYSARWDNYENFLEDMGRAPEGKYSINRIDNDGDYGPGNCHWATDEEQVESRRYPVRGRREMYERFGILI
jgi:hypothetical protein